jgi:hypothetical protein
MLAMRSMETGRGGMTTEPTLAVEGARPAVAAGRVALACVLAAVGIVVAAGSGASPPSDPTSHGTVVLSSLDDPYRALAEEIAATEELPLADELEDALARRPRYLLWVAAPQALSDEAMVRVGLALRDQAPDVSLGLITGDDLETARALWQREPRADGALLSIVPREAPPLAFCDPATGCEPVALDILGALGASRLISYQGHGGSRAWYVWEDLPLSAELSPYMEGAVVVAGSCQTVRPWAEDAIALAFVNKGVAAYVGFVHSPLGYVMGEPHGFALARTWPDYAVGDLARIWSRGLGQGFLAWPYLVVLGDPRLSLGEGPSYAIETDGMLGNRQTLTLEGAPRGIVPVRIAGGAVYAGARVHGGGVAWRGDPFYDADLQMVALGADLYLLVDHPGGSLELALYRRVPWTWRLWEPLVDALDHATVLQHIQGNLVPSLLLAALTALLVAWRSWRGGVALREHVVPALAVGLLLTLARAAYGLGRQAMLASLFEGYVRTLDVAYSVQPPILLATGVIATGGAWLAFDARRWFGRALAVMLALAPGTLMAPFWAAICLAVNVMAMQEYGAPLYGYGMAVMLAAATLVEAAVAAGALCVVARWRGGRLG